MGWNLEGSSHEGYLVALLEDDRGAFLGDKRRVEVGPIETVDPRFEMSVGVCQVACSCGWRSPVIRAHHQTTWVPCAVVTDERFEDECAKLWRHHVEHSPRSEPGMFSVHQLVRALAGDRGDE